MYTKHHTFMHTKLLNQKLYSLSCSYLVSPALVIDPRALHVISRWFTIALNPGFKSWHRVLLSCPGWFHTCNPPASASKVARRREPPRPAASGPATSSVSRRRLLETVKQGSLALWFLDVPPLWRGVRAGGVPAEAGMGGLELWAGGACHEVRPDMGTLTSGGQNSLWSGPSVLNLEAAARPSHGAYIPSSRKQAAAQDGLSLTGSASSAVLGPARVHLRAGPALLPALSMALGCSSSESRRAPAPSSTRLPLAGMPTVGTLEDGLPRTLWSWGLTCPSLQGPGVRQPQATAPSQTVSIVLCSPGFLRDQPMSGWRPKV